MNYLVAVTGLVPHVITQAMWCFYKQDKTEFDVIEILTTGDGNKGLMEGIPSRRFVPFLGPNSPVKNFCIEYDLKKQPKIHTTVFTESEKNIIISDVKNWLHFEGVAYTIIDTIRNLKIHEDDQVCCIFSGGRRLMASYLMAALMLVGDERHRLYYISHSPSELDKDPSFYYKPKIGRKLAIPGTEISTDDVELNIHEVLFPKLGAKYSGAIRNDTSYHAIVEHIQGYISNEPKPIISLAEVGEEEPIIIGHSERIKASLEEIKKFAEAGLSPLLLYGESGTGKELCAEYYSYWYSKKIGKKQQMLFINCGAIPKTLIESELFGAKKGSHSTAYKDQIGILANGEGKVAFLDEVDSAPLEFQSNLLRYLETGEIQTIGGSGKNNVPNENIRLKIVMALNRDVEELVEAGEIREDFYYRIKKGKVIIPRLNERKEDIPELVRYFFKKYCNEYKRNDLKISDDLVEFLCRQEWRGNIRELRDFFERFVILAENNEPLLMVTEKMKDYFKVIKRKKISDDDVINFITDGNTTEYSFEEKVEKFEKWLLEREYKNHGYNAAQAASANNIAESTFKSKLKKYGIVKK